MTNQLVDPAAIEAFQTDGAVFLPALLDGWVDEMAAGIEANLATPGEFAAENVLDGEDGRFFDDYCNWQRIPEFRRVVEESPPRPRRRRADGVIDGPVLPRPGQVSWHFKTNPVAQRRPLLLRGGDANGEFLGPR